MSDFPNKIEEFQPRQYQLPRGKPRQAPTAGIFDSPVVLVPINKRWAGHVSSVLWQLVNSDAWTDDTMLEAVEQVALLIDCVQGGGACKDAIPVIEVPVEVPVEVIVEKIITIINEESEESEMPCKDAILDIRWGKNGKLEVLKYDLCKGCVWTPVSSASGTLPPGNVGDYLDDAGDWIDDIFDNVFDNGGNAGEDVDPDLLRCRKATTIVTAITEIGRAVTEEYEENLPEPVPDWAIIGLKRIAEKLPPLITPVITLLGLSHIAYNFTRDLYDDMQAWLADAKFKQEMICRLVKLMTTADGLTGQDVSTVYTEIMKMGTQGAVGMTQLIAEFYKGIFKEMDLKRLNEAVQIYNVDTNACGCPDITGENAGQEPPDTFDWCYTFDFVADGYEGWTHIGTNGAAFAGEYVTGVGFQAKKAAFMTRLDLAIDFPASTSIVGVNIEAKEVKRGHYQENDDPNRVFSTIGLMLGIQNTAGLQRWELSDHAAKKVYVWRGLSMMQQGKRLQVMATVSYDGQGYENIPADDPGTFVMPRLTIWGNGANPFGDDNC